LLLQIGKRGVEGWTARAVRGKNVCGAAGQRDERAARLVRLYCSWIGTKGVFLPSESHVFCQDELIPNLLAVFERLLSSTFPPSPQSTPKLCLYLVPPKSDDG
jgi:hypothetical protein